MSSSPQRSRNPEPEFSPPKALTPASINVLKTVKRDEVESASTAYMPNTLSRRLKKTAAMILWDSSKGRVSRLSVLNTKQSRNSNVTGAPQLSTPKYVTGGAFLDVSEMLLRFRQGQNRPGSPSVSNSGPTASPAINAEESFLKDRDAQATSKETFKSMTSNENFSTPMSFGSKAESINSYATGYDSYAKILNELDKILLDVTEMRLKASMPCTFDGGLPNEAVLSIEDNVTWVLTNKSGSCRYEYPVAESQILIESSPTTPRESPEKQDSVNAAQPLAPVRIVFQAANSFSCIQVNNATQFFQVLHRAQRLRLEQERKIKLVILCQKMFRSSRIKRAYVHIRKSAIVIQSVCRAWKGRILYQKYRSREKELLPKRTKRLHVLKEISDTEESYVRHLENIVRIYLRPLKALVSDKKNSSTIQLNVIFNNIESIYEHHRAFLADLSAGKSSPGSLFLQMSSWLHIYESYCCNYEDSKAEIEKSMKLTFFANFIQKVSDLPESQQNDFSSLLILPVQRVPRYELLLRDVLRYTWEEHPDRMLLEDALIAIRAAAKSINRAKLLKDSKPELRVLMKKIPPCQVPGLARKYIAYNDAEYKMTPLNSASSELGSASSLSNLHGSSMSLSETKPVSDDAQVSSSSSTQNPKQFAVYLFSDIIVVAKKTSAGILTSKIREDISATILLENATLESGGEAGGTAISCGNLYELVIVETLMPDMKAIRHVLRFRSRETRARWIEDLRECMEAVDECRSDCQAAVKAGKGGNPLGPNNMLSRSVSVGSGLGSSGRKTSSSSRLDLHKIPSIERLSGCAAGNSASSKARDKQQDNMSAALRGSQSYSSLNEKANSSASDINSPGSQRRQAVTNQFSLLESSKKQGGPHR